MATQVNDKTIFEHRNTTDVFSRSVILAVLRLLNNLLKIQQVWSEDLVQDITIPFFFDFSGGTGSSEKFILDNYLAWTSDECSSIGIKPVDGDYRPLPYGVITLDSSQIDNGSAGNRFVMGKYQKRVNGKLESFVAFLYSIPISMSFTVNIGCDTINNMWKIELAYREFFYKVKTAHFLYKGTVVPCRVGFPESISNLKNSTYSFGNQQTDGTPDIKLSFSLSVETYLPVFDPYTEQPADNFIKNLPTSILILNTPAYEKKSGANVGKINTVKLQRYAIMTEEEILLEWSQEYRITDLLHVDIFIEHETGQIDIIDTIDNHGCYHLLIDPDYYDSGIYLDMLIPNTTPGVMVNVPKIKFFPDPETNIMDNSTCVVVDKGFIITDSETLDVIISYTDENEKILEHNIKLNITNGSIDPENPVNDGGFIYRNPVKPTKIKIGIKDHDNANLIGYFTDEYIYLY